MKYANVSVKFPQELDEEIEQFLAETGIHTNKSEFVKEACRRYLESLHNDPAIAALRVEQLLAKAERTRQSDTEISEQLSTLGEAVDEADLAEAVESAREDVSEGVHEQ